MSEWFCNIAGREIGPLTTKQLKAMARSGQLRPDDPIRQGPEGKWQPASRAKGLFSGSTDDSVHDTPSLPVAAPIQQGTGAGTVSKPAIVESSAPATAKARKSSPPSPPEVPPPIIVAGNTSSNAPPRAAAAPAPLAIGPAVSPGSAPGPLNITPSVHPRSGRSPSRAAQSQPEPESRKRRRNAILLIGGIGLVVALGVVVGVVIAMQSGSDKKAASTPAKKAPTEEELLGDLSDLEVEKPNAAGIPDLTGVVVAAEAAASKAAAPGAPATAAVPASADGERWYDAATESAKAGDLEVKILSVEIGPARYRAKAKSTDPTEDCLLVRLSVTNRHAEKKIDYRSWPTGGSSGRVAVLEDDKGNLYRQKPDNLREKLADQVDMESVYPGKAVEDLLAFQTPVAAAQELRLSLPGQTVGQAGEFRFKIVRAMIGRAPAEESLRSTAQRDREEEILSESRGGPVDIQRGIAEVEAERGASETPEDAAGADGAVGGNSPPKAEGEDDVVSKMNADIDAVGGGEEEPDKEFSMEEALEGDGRFAPPPDPDAKKSSPRPQRERRSADK